MGHERPMRGDKGGGSEEKEGLDLESDTGL